MTDTVLDRFLRYVQIDTQSDPASPTQPSTEKQKTLSRLLVSELQAIGFADAEMDSNGYVYATVAANTDGARLQWHGRKAADRQELCRRRYHARRRQEPRHPCCRASRAEQSDRQ
jgi:hypothetical protein